MGIFIGLSLSLLYLGATGTVLIYLRTLKSVYLHYSQWLSCAALIIHFILFVSWKISALPWASLGSTDSKLCLTWLLGFLAWFIMLRRATLFISLVLFPLV